MRLFVNAGFGSPLGVECLRSLSARGVAGIRQDMPDLDTARVLCKEVADARIQAILIVGKMTKEGPATPTPDIFTLARGVAEIARGLGLFRGPFPSAIEIGNEPDAAFMYKAHAETFAEAVRGSREAIRGVVPEAPIISGGIQATSREGLNYLEKAVRAGIPEDCIIGYHTYRTKQTPETPMPGFASRRAEFDRLRQIAGSRRIWCTESGWHTSPSRADGWRGWLGRTVRFNDAQVADFAEREIRINAEQGAEGFVWFQLNDGADPNAYEQSFGIQRLDGSWKPVADRISALGPTVA
jgi:hypothetical protein